MATKMVRWKCELCGVGKLAPSRPRMNDVRRYCLPCSEKEGVLVQRVSPTLEKQRRAKQEQRAQKVAKQRAAKEQKALAEAPEKEALRKAATFTEEGFVIKKEAERLWKLLAPYHGGKRIPTVEVNLRGAKVWSVDHLPEKPLVVFSPLLRSYAYSYQWRVSLRPHASWETLAHELVHCAVGARYSNGRREVHDKTFYDCLRDLTQRRFKITISFYEVRRYGYEVDAIIQRQLEKAGVLNVKKKEDAPA